MAQLQPYSYKVRTRQGQVLQGMLHGKSKASVSQRLRAQGYTVLRVDPPMGKTLWERLSQPRGRVPAKDMAMFCRQFAVMLSSGMSVIDSIRLVAELMKDVRLKHALEAARQDVLGGNSLGSAMAEQGHVFPPLVVQMVGAGETTGALHEVMERLAIYYEQEAEIRAKIKEALAYPTIVALVAVVAINVLVFFVLPTFVDVFKSMNMKLPPTTQFVLDASEFMLRWWWALCLALVAGTAALRHWVTSPQGRVVKDGLLITAPLLGSVVSKFVFSRFSRSLSLLVRSGVPVVEALGIVERLVVNVPVGQATARVRSAVERGSSLTNALEKESVFPRLLVQMVQVGEESGSIDLVMDQVADFYDREAGYAVKGLTTLIEPAIIVCMTGVVLFLSLAVVVPMFQMSTTIPGA